MEDTLRVHGKGTNRYKSKHDNSVGHIFRALMLKNFSLQLSQKKTNIIQVLFVALLMVVLGLLARLGAKIDADNASYDGNSYYNQPTYESYSTKDAGFTCYYKYTYSTCAYYNYFIYSDSTNGDIGTLFNNTHGTGLLGDIKQSPYSYYGYGQDASLLVPYFAPPVDGPDQVDQAIVNAVQQVNKEGNDIYSSKYWERYNMPTAAFLFDKLQYSNESFEIDYTLMTVPQDSSYTYFDLNFDDQIDKQTWLLNMMTNAILSNVTGIPTKIVSKAVSFLYLPYQYNFKFSDIVTLIGLFFLPACLFFSLPIIVFSVVYEKQEKLIEMMKMMGVDMFLYWIAQFVFLYLVYFVMTLFVIIVGAAFKIGFFVQVNPFTYIFLFALYGLSHVSMSFLLSCFFSNARKATIFSYFFCLLTASASSVIMLIVKNEAALNWLSLFPPFAVGRGIYIISYTTTGAHPEHYASLTHASPLLLVYLYLFMEAVILFGITWYLDQVLPRDHGVNSSVFAPFRALKDRLSGKSRKHGTDTESLLPSGRNNDVALEIAEPEEKVDEDADCAAIRRQVHSNADIFVKIVSLSKRYPSRAGQPPKDALSQFCLALNKGECLGLLGPNGAGKTTLISILCGMSKASSGYAMVDNMNIQTEMRAVHKILGLCPQHDIVWTDLSVEEHLLFYTRLKGYDKASERDHVREVAGMMGLAGPHLTKTPSELSGGMKRRLSIAISLVGASELVLMDEPTTGLDPETRRAVWDVINANKAGRSIIITTHNMEEADVLCGQIAIMSRGRLRCYGSPLYLKNRFGANYKLSLSIKANSFESVNSYIKNIFPTATADHTMGTTEFIIPVEDMNIGKLFAEMKHNKHPDIIEWGVNQMSLEEVFLKMIEQDEK